MHHPRSLCGLVGEVAAGPSSGKTDCGLSKAGWRQEAGGLASGSCSGGGGSTGNLTEHGHWKHRLRASLLDSAITQPGLRSRCPHL